MQNTLLNVNYFLLNCFSSFLITVRYLKRSLLINYLYMISSKPNDCHTFERRMTYI